MANEIKKIRVDNIDYDVAAKYDVNSQEITETYSTKTELDEVKEMLPEGETNVTFNGTETADTETLTNIVVDGKTYQIPQEIAQYIKNAVVSGNTITLTKQDNTTVSFTTHITATDVTI